MDNQLKLGWKGLIGMNNRLVKCLGRRMDTGSG